MFCSSPECKGQDTVTQPTGDVTAAEGDTVTLNCTFETTDPSPSLYWYKQGVNDSPKYLVKCFSKTVDHSPEIQKDRFHAEIIEKSVPLKIQKLQLSDSAVYYCLILGTRLFI
uniref:Ig-like domain-containing protein n=1 Tax=Lates calcarifer TaxID=8187 RepID=A0A4W6CFB4_LATCA